MIVYELSFQKNIRDIGGYVGYNHRKIKTGHLIRGGHLGKISNEDAVILNSLGITDVIDFRSEDEFLGHPDFRIEGAIYHNYPLIEDKIKKEDRDNADGNLLWFVNEKDTGREHMIKSYRTLITSDIGKKSFSNFFKLIMSKNGTFYFHCSQGKDRAGLAAYMLEIALGVSEEDALKDYLLTNKAMEIRVKYLLEIEKKKPYYSLKYEQALYDVFSAKEEFLNEALKAAKEEAGSMINYIKNILKVDIDKLREMYLE